MARDIKGRLIQKKDKVFCSRHGLNTNELHTVVDIYSNGRLLIQSLANKLYEVNETDLVVHEHLNRGTKVRKSSGDYHLDATIVVQFEKLSGQVRYVIEDDRGLLLIWNRNQFEVLE